MQLLRRLNLMFVLNSACTVFGGQDNDVLAFRYQLSNLADGARGRDVIINNENLNTHLLQRMNDPQLVKNFTQEDRDDIYHSISTIEQNNQKFKSNIKMLAPNFRSYFAPALMGIGLTASSYALVNYLQNGKDMSVPEALFFRGAYGLLPKALLPLVGIVSLGDLLWAGFCLLRGREVEDSPKVRRLQQFSGLYCLHASSVGFALEGDIKGHLIASAPAFMGCSYLAYGSAIYYREKQRLIALAPIQEICARLPVDQLRATLKENLPVQEEQENCVICLCPLIEEGRDNSSVESCNHIFHKDCLHQWLGKAHQIDYQDGTQGKYEHNTCPLCRAGVQK